MRWLRWVNERTTGSGGGKEREGDGLNGGALGLGGPPKLGACLSIFGDPQLLQHPPGKPTRCRHQSHPSALPAAHSPLPPFCRGPDALLRRCIAVTQTPCLLRRGGLLPFCPLLFALCRPALPLSRLDASMYHVKTNKQEAPLRPCSGPSMVVASMARPTPGFGAAHPAVSQPRLLSMQKRSRA